MVERHLKQMATDRGAAADAGDGRVLLRMAAATLPGTDLLLSRTPEGWVLRADVRSRSSFDAIRAAAPELARRFAARTLGPLSIHPHFHRRAPAPWANPRTGTDRQTVGSGQSVPVSINHGEP